MKTESEARWDKKFMDLALHISSWSKDRSRKVGCVVVGPDHEVRSIGYSGFPRGVDDTKEERHQRPAKYGWTEHAERNAFYNAARTGTSVSGCTIYIPWYPCIDCARGIVQSGISRMVVTEPNWNDSIWGDQFKMVREMFDEIGPGVVQVDFVDGPSMGDAK